MTSRFVSRLVLGSGAAIIMALVIFASFQPQYRPISANSCVGGLGSPETSKEIATACVLIAEDLVRKGATKEDAGLIHNGGLYSANDLNDADRAKPLLLKALELGYPESANEILVLFENNRGKYCADMDRIIQKLADETDIQKMYRKIWTESWTQQGCGPLQAKNA